MSTKGFEFVFKNPVAGSDQELTNVLFINETPSESDILKLVLTTVPGVTLTLNVANGDVSDSNYHFRLTCHPGVLAQPTEILLEAPAGQPWDMICIPEAAPAPSADEARAPGQVHLYVLYKGAEPLPVSTDEPLRLTLTKVGAVSADGTRPTITQLQLHYRRTELDDNVVLAGPLTEYNDTENANLDLIARGGGQSAPTLMAGFVSSDIVLNDGDTESYLLLRIVNTGVLPIPLSPDGSESPTKLTLRFAADNDTSRLWALGTISQVSSILIPGKPDSSATDPAWPGNGTWKVDHTVGETEWTLVPKIEKKTLEPDEAIEVPISKIVTGHATGRTALMIRYNNVPGHDDGELVAFIQKYPLVYADQLLNAGKPGEKRLKRIGIGTDSPSAKLTVETDPGDYEDGIAHTDGTVTLSTRIGEGMAALLTASEHPLMLATSHTRLLLTNDGKVGINVINPPSDTLVVATKEGGYGITNTNGTVKISTRLDASSGHLGTQTNHPLHFFTNGGAPQMTLTTDGKLGIGTDAPSEKLTVATTGENFGITHTNGTVKLSTWITEWGTAPNLKTGGGLGTQTDHPLYFYVNKTTKMFLATDGNVGIGTSEPSAKLTVKTGDYDGIVHTNGTVQLATRVTSSAARLGTLDAHPLSFFVDGDDKMTLTTEGRLQLKKKPIECKSVYINIDVDSVSTDYSFKDWVAVIAGFICESQDDDDDREVNHYCYVKEAYGNWHVFARRKYVKSHWRVHLIFIRRELVEGNYTYA